MLSPKDWLRIARMRRAGIVNPLITMQEARRANIKAGKPVAHPVALACALLEQETGGGHNVFGHDPTIFVGAGLVTKPKYLQYKAFREKSGNRLMQGVGPVQLTWWSTQDAADHAGGCWQPRYNMRIGFEKLFNNVHRYGLTTGVRMYNGSGDAAVRYANTVVNRFSKWKSIIR